MVSSAARRVRAVLAWVPAALLVPAGAVGLLEVSGAEEEEHPLAALHPLDQGTTWVYRVTDHGEPSGARVRQVVSQAAVTVDQLDARLVRSHYTDYPGQGERTDSTYLGLSEDALLQYGYEQDGQYVEVAPSAPAYQLPLEPGHTWRWEGTIGPTEAAIDSRVEAVEDVTVSGRTFPDCRHLVTEVSFTPTGSPTPVVETIEEWTCPGVGPVRSTDRLDEFGVDVTEELVSFQGPGGGWTAEGAEDLVAEATGADPAPAGPVPGATAGLDPGRSGAVEGELRPQLAWSDARSLDGDHPPVSDGRVMVLGEEDGQVTGTDVATGEVAWRVRLTAPVVAPPAVAGGVVLVADGRKQLWALDLADGSARWVRGLDDVVSASPVPVEGSDGSQGSADLVVVPTDDGAVTALDLADGAERWHRTLGFRTDAAPALVDTTEGRRAVVVGDPDGGLTALDAATGATEWESGLEGQLAAGPAARDGRVLAADVQGVVYSLAGEDGEPHWASRTRFDPTGSIAVGEDVAVVLGGPERVEGFALEDGDKVWSEDVPATEESPVVVGDEAVTVGRHGEVVQRDLATGAVTASWELPAPAGRDRVEVDKPVGVVGGTLVVSAVTGAESQGIGMYAYPLTDDAARPGVWFGVDVRATGTSPSSPPTLDGDTLYVPGMDFALHRSTGLEDVEPVHQVESLQPGVLVHEGLLLAQRDRELVAYGLDDGERRWTFPMPDPFPGTVPAGSGDTVFVPQYGVGLAAVGTDGTPRWFTPIEGADSTTSPLPLPGGDVVHGSGRLARYDGDTGEPVWTLEGQAYGPLAADGGLVFADLVPRQGAGGLVAVDAATGEVRWRHRTDWHPISVGPVAADGVVVFADSRGLVVALAAADGRELWRVRLSTPPAGSPVVQDGRVYLAETGRSQDILQRDYRVSAHDLRTGAFLGALQPPGQDYIVTPSFTGSDGRLLVPAVSFRQNTIMILEPRG